VFPRLFLLLLLPGLLLADDHWIALKSGPFEVFSNAGERPAREKLMFLEQFRETLRVVTGKQEMQLVWPVHVIISTVAPVAAKRFKLGRDARMLSLSATEPISRDDLKELARLLLYENTSRLPPDVESGLIALVSTIQVDGPRITLGAPVPEAERSRGWALMHLVTASPEYAGRTRVMISNLEQTGDFEAACHNAFEKTAAQINQQTDAYLKAGNFPTAMISGRAFSLRDFKPVQLGSDDVRIAQADLLLATGHAQEAAAAYKDLKGPVGSEGLALMDLDNDKEKPARTELQDAIDGGSSSARAWLELGRLNSDEIYLKKATELNPRWAEPYFQRADIDPAVDKEHLEKRAVLLKKAASLEPRNIDYWTALAKNDVAAGDFADAQRAWGGAEHAAATDEEREHIHQLRASLQEKRFDLEAAERKRLADEREADINRVKSQSEAAIHAAEDAARKRLNPDGAAPPKADTWYHAGDDGSPIVQGTFARLDCLGKQARLVIQTADGKTVQLLVPDPSQLETGAAQQSLSCGPQKPERQVVVHYNAKPDAKLKTAGVATAIEFH
jgi:tetratricopeptide (TPR) repeat protein